MFATGSNSISTVATAPHDSNPRSQSSSTSESFSSAFFPKKEFNAARTMTTAAANSEIGLAFFAAWGGLWPLQSEFGRFEDLYVNNTQWGRDSNVHFLLGNAVASMLLSTGDPSP
ncbi:hypothetical protein SLEP1_g57019 [Rubroshorea leprosula]|uniref:Uncharacterized protein n=1 Tax=Rubroshorea leprosula TaxID=152421 RepID=A0AAV5MPG2_9ROSI|nr:hypothetical protein SLEP1_g57019 [Rubroshorea leprosula]